MSAASPPTSATGSCQRQLLYKIDAVCDACAVERHYDIGCNTVPLDDGADPPRREV